MVSQSLLLTLLEEEKVKQTRWKRKVKEEKTGEGEENKKKRWEDGVIMGRCRSGKEEREVMKKRRRRRGG